MASSCDARRCAAALPDNRLSLPPRLKRHLPGFLFTLCALTLALTWSRLTSPIALAGEIMEPGRIAETFRSPIDNAFCTVPTFAVLALPGQARALLEGGKRPLILIDTEVAASGAYARFLLAHECCHHQRGHLARLAEQQRKRELAWQNGAVPETEGPGRALGNLSFTMSHRRMELDADCCAAALLAKQNDAAGLEAAIAAMEAFGARPTGPSYPPGLQRAMLIKSCAGG